MPDPTFGIITSAVFGAGLAAHQGSKNRAAAREATEMSYLAQMENLAWQKQQYTMEQETKKPWIEAGKVGLGKMQEFIEGGFDVTKSPAFQAEMKSGEQMLNRRLSSLGMLRGRTGMEMYTDLLTKMIPGETKNIFGMYSTLAGYGNQGFTTAPNLTAGYGSAGHTLLEGAAMEANATAGMAGVPLNAMNAILMGQKVYGQPTLSNLDGGGFDSDAMFEDYSTFGP